MSSDEPKQPNLEDSKHNDPPPTLISILRGLSTSRPSSPSSRVSGSIAAGRHFRSASQTQSLSTSPHNFREFKPSNPGSLHTGSNPPSSISSPLILPADKTKGWQPPTRVIQPKPSVELFMPTARFTSCLSPNKDSCYARREDDQFTSEETLPDFKETSDTASVASMRLSRYSQANRSETTPSAFEEESTVVDSNASSVVPQGILFESSQLDDLSNIKHQPEENSAAVPPMNEPVPKEEKATTSPRPINATQTEQSKPDKRSSWWSFGGSSVVEIRPEPTKQPETILQKIEPTETEVPKESIPEGIPPVKAPPASSWWTTFSFASGSTPDTASANYTVPSTTAPLEAVATPPAGEETSSSPPKAQDNQLITLESQKATSPPRTSPTPYPGSEPSLVARSLRTMAPTWRYFFSKQNTSHLQNSTQKLVGDTNGDVTSMEVALRPPDSTPQEAPPVITPPPPNKDTAKAQAHPNLVLPVLDVVSLSKSFSPSPVLRYALDTISYYTGYQFSEQSNQYSSTFFPPSIHKVVIIGVHGWFPLKIYQKMIGEPTGTSEKFCSRMTNALQTYLLDHYGLALPEDAITQIPLSCEGKIEARLNKLYSKLLSNSPWMAALSEADNVIIAAHSQGTPVSAMLLNRLIRDGLLDPSSQRTSILAMAGITHGPFPFLKENYIVKYFETEAARELFEFMKPSATIVKQYNEAMQRVLESGVRVCAIASMTDQVVPLHSGVMHGFTHPGILRALYIDGVNYTPDFLTSLIVFALLLRNHGHSDHDLIMHLSDVVAGSLYSGTQGHSTIYEERKVYTTAIQWHFAHDHRPAKLKISALDAHTPLNPYFLPWIMRGLLDDHHIRRNIYLSREVEDLQSQFSHWQPMTKPFKELQFRLEPIRDQLMPDGADTS